MAQELIDKIRAAAQAKGIDPDVAVQIARAESALKPGVRAGTSSAGGLFQVVDKTWKEFGGAPGKKFDPDENIRVGTEVISSNTNYLRKVLNRDPRPAEVYAAHYFGPSGAKNFLSAEPGTPMESLFSAQVIKANPNLKGKTSGEVLATLEKKMGAPRVAPPAVSRETPAPRKELPPSLPPMAAAPASPGKMAADLGPGYQAALALSFLADNDDKEDRDIDREPGVAEKWLAEQAPRPSALAGFSDISIKSPFAEPQQPQMLNEGGEVGESKSMLERFYEADKDMSRLPRPPTSPLGLALTAGNYAYKYVTGTDPLEDLKNRLNKKLRQEPDTGEAPKREGIPRVGRAGGSPEEGEVAGIQEDARKGEAYQELEKYLQSRDAMPDVKVTTNLPEGTNGLFNSDNLNIGSGTIKIYKDTPKVTAPSTLTHEMTHAADRQMRQQAIEQGMFGNSNQYTEAYEKLVGQEGRNRSELARMLKPEWEQANRYYRASPKEIAAHGVGAFAGPTLQDRGPRHIDATAATELRILMDLAQRNVDNGPKGLEKIPAFFRKMGRYADGGEVEQTLTPQQIERIAAQEAAEREAASRPATVNPNIQRQGEAAKKLAAMRDVNTLPDPKTYAAVSGFLGTPPDEQGFSVMHPDREGIKQAGEAGFFAGTAAQVAPLGAALRGIGGKGTTTAAKMMEGMKDVPVGMSIKPVQSIYSPIPSAEAPFVGRLDEFVSNLPGAVQKDQFLGMLKGKFRDYDIARAEETLADLPGNAKLSPVDLLNRIKTQYDPSQFKTTVVPPGSKISNYQSTDNPYQGITGDGPPLGVIHLSQNNPAREQLQEVMDKVDTALFKLGSQSYDRRWSPEMADQLLQAANNPALRLSESTSEGLRTLGTQYGQLSSQQKALNEARSDMIYPAANPEFNKTIQAYAEEFGGPGINISDSYRQARVRATREAFERGNDFLRANNAPTMKVPDFDSFQSPSMWAHSGSNPLTPGADELYEQARGLFAVAERPLVEARLALAGPADSLSKAFLKEISHNTPYMGQHTALKNSPHDPISFSRFSEHTTDIPGIGKADGIYVNELQSDLLDDLRKKGVKGGSLEKDEKKLRELESRMRGITDSTEREALESKMRNLRTRLYMGMGPNNTPNAGFYELSGSFPGMESSPQVAQQLMVKNAISGAMQMGKQFVAFPGAESAQAQLYEKLGPNLKSVVKDLGPGFELRDVTLRDPDGKQLMHKAIVWGPDAAARVQKKGVPFKDGGAVERQTADHRKYL